MNESHLRASNFLEHYGVKGMKWGVRREDPPAPSPRSISSDASRARKSQARVDRHGGTHALSNRDLQDLVIRLNLEQQYSRLNPLPPSTAQKALKVVKGAAAAGRGMNSVLAFVNSPAGKLLRKAIIGV